MSANPRGSRFLRWDEAGGAVWEYSTVLKADLERGLAWLTPTDRELVLAAHESGNPTAKLYTQRPSARNARLRVSVDRILDQLTRIMNGGEDVATNVSVNGTQQTEELERLHQAIARKLAHLPPGWETVVVKREARTPGEFAIKVQY